MAVCPHCGIELPDVPTGSYRTPGHDRMECIENLQSDKRRLSAENERLRAENERMGAEITLTRPTLMAIAKFVDLVVGRDKAVAEAADQVSVAMHDILAELEKHGW